MQLRIADKCLPPLFFCDLTRKLPLRLLPFQPRAWPFVTCRGSLWALSFPSGLNFPCNISAELRASSRADRPAVAGHGDATVEGRQSPGAGGWRNDAYARYSRVCCLWELRWGLFTRTMAEPDPSWKTQFWMWQHSGNYEVRAGKNIILFTSTMKSHSCAPPLYTQTPS